MSVAWPKVGTESTGLVGESGVLFCWIAEQFLMERIEMLLFQSELFRRFDPSEDSGSERGVLGGVCD